MNCLLISCGATQSLLKSHENAESEIRLYSSEIERLKELSRKVIDGATTTAAQHYVCCR